MNISRRLINIPVIRQDFVLKDADVIDHCLTDPTKEIKEKERNRYEKLCKEFGLEG